jgi:pimeloyl-ACP methyl ester carboxylesterase
MTDEAVAVLLAGDLCDWSQGVTANRASATVSAMSTPDGTYRTYRRGPMRTVWPSPARPASRRAARRADGDYGVPAEPGWRDVDWPAATRTATVGGSDVNYVELGSGERAVVFVHGLGGSWQNWLENLPATAAAGYRAIALDLPGFGRSPMPAEPISITGYARVLDDFCDALGLGHVALVGNSMGGFISAEAGIRHPDRVERLVLVDAAGISTEIGRNRISERFGKFMVTGVLNGGGAAAPSHERLLAMLRRPGFVHLALGAVARHPTLLSRELLAEQLGSVGAPAFNPAFNAIIGYHFLDRLGDIGCPTLVVQGTEDMLVPLGDAYEFERRIPMATTLILEDTGHVPQFERPAAFNRGLLEFLGQDVAPHEPSVEEAPTLAQERA